MINVTSAIIDKAARIIMENDPWMSSCSWEGDLLNSNQFRNIKDKYIKQAQAVICFLKEELGDAS